MFKVVVIGKQDYISALYRAGLDVTLDPLDGHPAVCDASMIKSAPYDVLLIVILSGGVTDWAAKQARPGAVFVHSIEEAIDILQAEKTRSMQRPEEKPPADQLLVLTHSNKGGVGKTTTAIALAETLGQRVKTVLCDFDYTGPDIGPYYNIKSQNYFEKPVQPAQVSNNLYILPWPKNIIPATLQENQFYDVVKKLTGFQVIVGDTPPAPWDKPHFHPLFAHSDMVFSIMDQSSFSLEEAKEFAPTLISMGVSPENISIILNKYSPRQASIKSIEQAFSANLLKKVSPPKVIATIPHDWDKQLTAAYKGKVLNKDIWEEVSRTIYGRLGVEYVPPEPPPKRFFDFLKRKAG